MKLKEIQKTKNTVTSTTTNYTLQKPTYSLAHIALSALIKKQLHIQTLEYAEDVAWEK